jgi:hypothetical protein
MLERLEDRTVPSTSIPLSSTSWTDIGPAPIQNGQVPGSTPVSGRVTGLAADPSNANILYAATAGGGVWKTTDAGNTWTPLTDGVTDANGQPVVDFMGAVAVAPSNSSVVYAGTGEANNSGDSFYGEGILVSTNGGSSWTLTGQSQLQGTAISRIAVDPQNPDVAFAAVSNFPVNGNFFASTGIYMTSNAGGSWTNVTAANGLDSTDPWSDVVIDPTTTGNTAVLFAAVGNSGGASGNGVYESTNGGTSWTAVSALPSGSTVGRTALAIAHPSSASKATVYASIAGSDGALLNLENSTDGGTTWTDLTANLNGDTYLNTQGWYDNVVAVDPANTNIAFAAGVLLSQGGPNGFTGGGIVETQDGGKTWTDGTTHPDINTGTAGNNGPHTDYHALAFDANAKLVVGNDGGVWRLDSNDIATPNIAWTNLNGNLETIQFTGVALDPTNANTAYGGSQDNGTEQFSDSRTWNRINFGDGGFAGVDPVTPSTFYVEGSISNRPVLQRFDNGGATRTDITPGIANLGNANFYPPYVVDPTNHDRLLFGTDVVNVSTNQGGTWTTMANLPSTGNGIPINSIAVDPSNGNHIYVTAGSDAFVTTNNGGSWTTITPPGSSGTATSIAADPNNGNTAYVVYANFVSPGSTGNGQVFQTTNGGTSWTNIGGTTFPDFPARSVIVVPNSSLVAVGTDVGVYATSSVNGTNTVWSRLASGLPDAQAVDLEAATIQGQTILAVGTHGRGMWELAITVDTTTTITSTAVSSTYNSTNPQQVTLTAQVAPAGSGTVNEGTVTFTVANLTTSAKVMNGTATATLTIPAGTAAGSYTINASYSDGSSGHFNSSTAGNSGTLTINQASTQLSPASASATYNTGPQSVTLQATVTSPNGGTVNEGTVTFAVGNLQSVQGTVNAQGVATATLNLPAGFAPGSYSYNLSYADGNNVNGIANYGPISASTTFVVNPAATKVAVSNASATYSPTNNQQVTLQATVTSPGGPVNEGNVTFTVGSITATVGVNSSGTASTTITLPAGFAAGSYTITANYADTPQANGTVFFAPNTGSGTLTVAGAATQTAVTSTSLSIGFNSGSSQQVTLTASVGSSAGTVSEGNVSFTVGNLSVQGSVSGGSAMATLTVPAGFAAGAYSIGAKYADTPNSQGGTNFAASTAPSGSTLTVTSAGTALSVGNANASYSTANQNVTLQATVTSPSGGTVTEGTVTFTVGNLPSVTGTVNSSGMASAALTLPGGFARGNYAIAASYADILNANNTVNYGPSTATPNGQLTIGVAPIQLQIGSVNAVFNSTSSQTVTLTADITSPGGGTVNEGSVSFTVGNLGKVSGSVNSLGQVSVGLTLPAEFAAGSYSINAAYTDSLGNYTNASGTGTLAVASASSQTSVNNVNATFNSASQTITLTANVTSSNGGTVNEGNVSFTVGSLGPVSGMVNSSGTASAQVSLPASFAAGNYAINASYADVVNANNIVNFVESKATAGTLSLATASSQLSVTNVSTQVNPTNSQQVTLSATVTSSNGGTVNEGSVTFTVGNLTPVSGSVNSSGMASATLMLPAGFSVGNYSISASYADVLNVNQLDNFAASSGSGTLSIVPIHTVTSLAPSSLTATFSTLSGQVTLTANVSSSVGAVAEGKVTFTVGNLPSVTAAVNSSGVATAVQPLPAGFAAGSYDISATYTDTSSPNYTASGGVGTLTVQSAATTTTTGNASVTFLTSTQQIMLTANVSGPGGVAVSEGKVTFTVAGQTATTTVFNGTALATITLPASLAAGSYTISASYNDATNANGTVNFVTSAGSGTLTVGAAATQLSVNNVSTVASSAGQPVTLTATVTAANGSTVNEGVVTFTAAGQVLTAAVSGGVASAVLDIPAGFPPGASSINASYADGTNANGQVNFASSAAPSGTLSLTYTTTIRLTQVSLSPSFLGVSETVTAQVSNPNGPLNGGVVTFNVGGVQVQAGVSGGLARASVVVPLSSAGGSQGITATYSDASGLNSTSFNARTAMLSFFNEFLSAVVTFGADGSEMVTLDFFGLPLVFTYNASGALTGVFLGSLPI